jgi:hypothetical protein
VVGEQRLEVAEVGAQLLDRDGGVLPPGVRRAAVAGPGGEARAGSLTSSASTAPASATIRRARSVTSAASSPVSSTISQPSPRGRSGTTAAGTSSSRWTIRESRPSTAVGEYARSPGVASAASGIDG